MPIQNGSNINEIDLTRKHNVELQTKGEGNPTHYFLAWLRCYVGGGLASTVVPPL